MSAELPASRVPEVVDAWRMVAARREFEGSLSLSSLPRLREALCDDAFPDAAHGGAGVVHYVIGFDRDALQVPYVELRIDAALPLTCQRTLQRFDLPVEVVQRLGLLPADADEAQEAALPPDYEPLLVPEDGMLRLAELVEDELILAVPVVPIAPGSEALERDWPVQEDEAAQANPFAALSKLKKAD